MIINEKTVVLVSKARKSYKTLPRDYPIDHISLVLLEKLVDPGVWNIYENPLFCNLDRFTHSEEILFQIN